MLCALERVLEVPRQVVLAGDPGKKDFQNLAMVCREKLGPRRGLLAVDPKDEGGKWLMTKVPAIAEMKLIDGQATAYVCENFTCQAPVTNPDNLRKLLNDGA